jgi:hypothetical protein
MACFLKIEEAGAGSVKLRRCRKEAARSLIAIMCIP